MKRDELEKTRGRYKTNQLIRKKIDKILHDNAILFQNIGSESTPEEIKKAKNIEWRNLQLIKLLDYGFWKRVCPYSKNDM